MIWHIILLIALIFVYLGWKIYLHLNSIRFEYHKTPKNNRDKLKRKKFEIKYAIKDYYKCYGIKDLIIPILIWLIYGGIFIW